MGRIIWASLYFLFIYRQDSFPTKWVKQEDPWVSLPLLQRCYLTNTQRLRKLGQHSHCSQSAVSSESAHWPCCPWRGDLDPSHRSSIQQEAAVTSWRWQRGKGGNIEAVALQSGTQSLPPHSADETKSKFGSSLFREDFWAANLALRVVALRWKPLCVCACRK